MGYHARMTSLWLTNRVETATPPELGSGAAHEADVVVIGAGITGLTTAVLLARAGKRVVVLEARYVGAGTTGNTTGKVSLLQGTKLSRIAAKHGIDTLSAYAEGNSEGRDWLLRHCEDHRLHVQHEDAYSYAQSADGVGAAMDELAAARQAGLDVRWAKDAEVPFPFHGGVRLADQAQLDPLPLLSSFIVELEAHGGSVFQGLRATSVHGNGKLRIEAQPLRCFEDSAPQRVSFHAQHCVLATGIPILDRGLYFARLKPQRSYCLGFDVPGDVTRPMFITVDSPTRSVRYAPTPEGEKLVVGGAGHTVGRSAAPTHSVAELSRWARLHYPGAVQTHFWSAQDYAPVDELPYVGPILPNTDKIYVATGFDKWGLTNGVAAALSISSQILGGRMDWARAFASWSPHERSGVTTALKSNLEVGFNLAKGWVTHLTGADEPPDGAGVVSGVPWNKEAKSNVDGFCRTSSPVCPHLGGIVTWNDADHAWECPLHGSRFAPDGEVLEGPATRGLAHAGHPG